jgi:large conductance mechanosensitive channel
VLAGFKEFIFRGNVIDLAVGVIIGAAFGTIVTSMTEDVITPLIGMAGGQPDFSAITAGPIQLGKFINAVVAFLITAAALYVLIVAPMNKFKKMQEQRAAAAAGPAPEPETPADIKLLEEIRDLLKAKA